MRIIEVIKNFLILYSYLSQRRKIQTYSIIFLMTITSILEVFSIGMIIPFTTVLLNPINLNNLSDDVNVLNVFKSFGIDNVRLFLTIIFITAFTLSSLFKMICIYLFHRISKSIAADINMVIFNHLLFNRYHHTIKENSGYRLSALTEKSEIIIGLFFNAFTFFSGAIILIFTSFVFLIIKPILTMITLILLTLLFLTISKFLNKVLLDLSVSMAKKISKKLIIIQEAVGGLRQIILDKTQRTYSGIFEKEEVNLRKEQAKAHSLTYLPRHIVEIISITIVAIVSYYLMQNQIFDPIELVTILGFVGFAAIRLLPITTSMYQSYNTLLATAGIINEFSDFMQNKAEVVLRTKSNKDILFKKNIVFKNVSFAYEGSTNFKLDNINFEILKKEKVGIIGQTGSGKSTIIDIIIGLLETQKGNVLIDGVELNNSSYSSWQEKISHVPQEIFLMDKNIAQNIAFTLHEKDINYQTLKEAIKIAELEEFVENLKYKEKTIIGERGIFISGGQKQRIGLARAFYNQKEILILDEATSSLDIATEKKIIDNIRNKFKDITIIQISHRLKTLQFMDKILKFEKNGNIKIENYHDLII